MSRTNLLLAIPKSFYSGSMYREVAETWHGRRFLYLLILLFICWIVIAGVFTVKIHTATYYFAQELTTSKFPTINFKSGVASTKTTTPYYHYIDVKLKKGLIIVDTTDKIRDFHQSKAKILIQKRSIFVKDDMGKIERYFYPKQITMDIGPKQVQAFLYRSRAWLPPLIFVIILFGGLIISYAYRVIQILIYALIGMLFRAILKRELFYESLMSLAIISITPAIVISTILLIFNISYPFEWLSYFLLSMVYLFFIIKANPKKALETSE
jgi:hypothetical protein